MNRNSPDEHLSSPIGTSPVVLEDSQYGSRSAMDAEEALLINFVLLGDGRKQQQERGDGKHTERSKQDHPRKAAPPASFDTSESQPWGEWDVPLGRSQEVREYIGNVRYREMVEYHRPAYLAAVRRSEKTSISNTIYAAIRSRGGRFLDKQESSETTTEAESTTWVPISHEKALAKISQALRIGTGKQPSIVPNVMTPELNQPIDPIDSEVPSSSDLVDPYPPPPIVGDSSAQTPMVARPVAHLPSGAGAMHGSMRRHSHDELEPSMSNMTISMPQGEHYHPYNQSSFPYWHNSPEHSGHHHRHGPYAQPPHQSSHPMPQDFSRGGFYSDEDLEAAGAGGIRLPHVEPDEERLDSHLSSQGGSKRPRYFGEEYQGALPITAASRYPGRLIRHHSYDDKLENNIFCSAGSSSSGGEDDGSPYHHHRHHHRHMSSFSSLPAQSDPMVFRRHGDHKTRTTTSSSRRGGRRRQRQRSAPESTSSSCVKHSYSFSYAEEYRLGLEDVDILGVGDDDLVLPPEFGWGADIVHKQQQQQQQETQVGTAQESSADQTPSDLHSSSCSFDLEELLTQELGDIEPAPELLYHASLPDMRKRKGRSQTKEIA